MARRPSRQNLADCLLMIGDAVGAQRAEMKSAWGYDEAPTCRILIADRNDPRTMEIGKIATSAAGDQYLFPNPVGMVESQIFLPRWPASGRT